MTPILGPARLTAAELATWYAANAPAPPRTSCSLADLIGYYLTEGAAVGVAGDLAFMQSVHETAWFQFGGDVPPDHNNFAGLAATGGVPGAAFPTPQIGVRAQVQHLNRYAGGPPVPASAVVDPRYVMVWPGVAPNWEQLDGRWAVPGVGYGETIVRMWQDALESRPGGGSVSETWCPFATVERGPYDGGSHGGPVTAHDGLVEHVTTNWADPGPFFSQPINQASSHAWIRRDGLLVQFLPLEVASWAQSAGNYSYVSVETDGTPDVPLSNEQVATFGRFYTWVEQHPVYGGFGFALAEAPGQRGLGWHGMGGAAWGGHYSCPGDLRKAQRPQVLAIAQGSQLPPSSEEDDMDPHKYPGAFVRLRYREILLRNVDPAGYGTFVPFLQQGGDPEKVVQALTDSTEGQNAIARVRAIVGL